MPFWLLLKISRLLKTFMPAGHFKPRRRREKRTRTVTATAKACFRQRRSRTMFPSTAR